MLGVDPHAAPNAPRSDVLVSHLQGVGSDSAVRARTYAG